MEELKMTVEEIRKETNSILGKDNFEGLKNWYTELNSRNTRYRYVVYLSNQCYTLALIMEKITEKKIEDHEYTEFLTDTSLFLKIPELAAYYKKNKKFPGILLCDLILNHGKEINRFIEYMEDLLTKELSNYDSEKIKGAFADALNITTYARVNGPTLVFPRYEIHLTSKRHEEICFCRDLSLNISTLITRLGLSDSMYIASSSIDPKVVKKIKSNSEWKETTYYNNWEKAKVSLEIRNDCLYAIKTIRIINSDDYESYRVIPFIFLPNLAESETMNIWNELSSHLKKFEGWNKYKDEIKRWMSIYGMRSFNEWITLLWSTSILKEFQKKYKISFDEEDLEEECRKLARNYNWSNIKEATEFIKWTIYAVNIESSIIMDIFISNAPDRYILKVNPNSSYKFEPENLDSIEDIFYNMACEDEKEAYETIREFLPVQQKRTVRHLKDICMILKETEYDSADEIQNLTRYLLQMMDSNIFSVTCYPATDIKVVGYSQFVKIEEQALYIWAIRYCEYIPLLIRIEERSQQINAWIKDELTRYMADTKLDIPIQMRGNLIAFIKRMQSMAQVPSDWRMSYVYKYRRDDKSLLDSTMERVQKQRTYVKDYAKYIRGDY